MSWLQLPDFHLFLVFTLVLTRLSGLMMTAPIYGTPDVPLQARVLLVFGLSLLVTPTQASVAVADPGAVTGYLIVLASELFIGLILGLGVNILFSGIQLAGQLISQTSGLTMADIVNPSSGESVPQLSHFLHMVAIAVFVTMGGQRIVMEGLLETFGAIPLGSGLLPLSLGSIVEALELLVSQSLMLGVRAAGPLLTALMLATLVVTLIGRTLPQLNVMVLGFGLNSVITFGALCLCLGAVVWVFQDELTSTVETLLEAMQTMT